jgi:hypothetical protein
LRYPERYKVVRYESLLACREATLREICAFVGEAFVPAMLTLEGAMRFGDERDDESAADERPHAPLSRREIAFIQRYAGRTMAAWDYQPRPVALATHDRLAFALVDWPANLARVAAWRAIEALQRHTPSRIGRMLAVGPAK